MSFFTEREKRPFWLFLPFLVLTLGITSAYLKFPINIIVALLLLASGAVVFFATNRAARLSTERADKESEIEMIFKAINDAIIAYDENFRIVYFNPAAERLFKVAAWEVTGKQLKPQDAENAERKLLTQVMFPTLAPQMVPRSAPGEYPQIVDISLVDPAQEFQIATSRLINAGNKVIGFLKVVEDRTRETQIIRSKNEFVTIASHQSRTPINELNWALEALAANTAMPADAKEVTSKALLSARKLATLVEDLLDISRMEEGRFGCQFETVDIAEFLGKVAASAMQQAESAGLTLYFNRPKEALPQVSIDPQKLGMVAANILDNAIRYNVEHGEIVVGVDKAKEGPYVEVIIKDSGIGVSKEEVARLFTKFFRAENAVKYATEGSGLGLYIAKNIVEAHGGRIWVESELNRGTTVHFTIPTDSNLVPLHEAAIE
ncbi:MAG: ATP-binding protein [Candidatus Liptonbacteria bacterium]